MKRVLQIFLYQLKQNEVLSLYFQAAYELKNREVGNWNILLCPFVFGVERDDMDSIHIYH